MLSSVTEQKECVGVSHRKECVGVSHRAERVCFLYELLFRGLQQARRHFNVHLKI